MPYSKLQAIKEILDIEEADKVLSKFSISVSRLAEILAKEKYALDKELGITPTASRNIVKSLCPDKPANSTKICTYLLRKYGLKCCSKCGLVLEIEDFSKNAAKSDGYNTFCKSCYTESTREYQREYQRTRKALKLSRLPSWANKDKIKEIYDNCPPGYHVDHIIPLQGEKVSGLHIETNLQYLTAAENCSKRNKYLVG